MENELFGTGWSDYNDLDPTPTTFDQKYWNKGYKLSNWVPCYDWISGDGYNNFSTWIDNAK